MTELDTIAAEKKGELYMQYDEALGEGYTKEGVLLIVEQQDEAMVITYAQLEVEDMYNLCIEFIDRMSKMTRQTYNQVCEDLKEIEEESD